MSFFLHKIPRNLQHAHWLFPANSFFFTTVMMSAHRPDHEFSWEADNAGSDPHPGSRAQYRGQGTGELALCLCLQMIVIQNSSSSYMKSLHCRVVEILQVWCEAVHLGSVFIHLNMFSSVVLSVELEEEFVGNLFFFLLVYHKNKMIR